MLPEELTRLYYEEGGRIDRYIGAPVLEAHSQRMTGQSVIPLEKFAGRAVAGKHVCFVGSGRAARAVLGAVLSAGKLRKAGTALTLAVLSDCRTTALAVSEAGGRVLGSSRDARTGEGVTFFRVGEPGFGLPRSGSLTAKQ